MQSLSIDQVTTRLSEFLGDDLISSEVLFDFMTFTISKEKVFDAVQFLKEDTQLNFHFLTTLCGLHYPQSDKPFGLMVQLHNMPVNLRIRIKTFTSESDPVFKSLTSLWPSANWMEREAYDFFGFRFSGHPDMRRILNMDSLEGWPLRKEYPLEDPFRKDKDDKMFGR